MKLPAMFPPFSARLPRWLVIAPALLALLAFPAWGGPGRLLDRGEDWFASAEGRRVAENILSHQSPHGGWAKNLDTSAAPFEGDPSSIQPTFDNGATTDELRFLARAWRATGEARYRGAFERGLDHLLEAQYPHGGWPQRFPAGRGYHRHVTFNDHAMVRVLEFLREVSTAGEGDDFPDEARRAAAERAFERGIDCILRCQVVVDGRPTVWCAQHDADDLRPATGRSYELPSLSGAESVGVVRLLMSLDPPSAEIVRAVEAAAAWFEESKIEGWRVVERRDPALPGGRDRVLVEDPAAAALWPRFAEIGSNEPLFVDRDGEPRATFADLSHERRNGYRWLGNWPQRLLDRELPAWRERHGLPRPD